MNSENKNDLLGFDLDEIFEEESKKAPRFFTDESSLNAERNIYLQKRLSEKLIHEFETKFSIDAGNIMFGILSRLSILPIAPRFLLLLYNLRDRFVFKSSTKFN